MKKEKRWEGTYSMQTMRQALSYDILELITQDARVCAN